MAGVLRKDDELRQLIGRRVRDLRNERGISQEALADLANLHRTYIGRLERGESGTTVDTLVIVTRTLGVSLAEFFKGIN